MFRNLISDRKQLLFFIRLTVDGGLWIDTAIISVTLFEEIRKAITT